MIIGSSTSVFNRSIEPLDPLYEVGRRISPSCGWLIKQVCNDFLKRPPV